MKTTYIVQPFVLQKIKGQSVLKPEKPMQFNYEDDALRRAERMAEKFDGVVVSQEYDEESGEMGKTVLLRQIGQVPEEIADSFS
ncbi:hypothetical protein [Neisseria bacilliformis]|jgi:hypothetical protein|uniref:hypothetical protein n=1 Tax=Neisseria bacilliformis TaxID=267212 RepID=UPI0028E5EEA8|nr:hypothetical protein [Neisseria bacilliformis]